MKCILWHRSPGSTNPFSAGVRSPCCRGGETTTSPNNEPQNESIGHRALRSAPVPRGKQTERRIRHQQFLRSLKLSRPIIHEAVVGGGSRTSLNSGIFVSRPLSVCQRVVVYRNFFYFTFISITFRFRYTIPAFNSAATCSRTRRRIFSFVE